MPSREPQPPAAARGRAARMARAEEWLAQRWVGWLLLALVAGIYTAAYLRHPLLPDRSPAEVRTGWWTWSDQFVYWQAAADLAHCRLTAESYHYAPGYPALGALFWKLTPAHPFFVPDLLLVLATAVIWWKLARRWLNRMQTLLVGVIFVALHRELLELTLVVPWNTIATQCTLLAGMWAVVALTGARAVRWLAGLAALTYFVRPADAACFAPMLIWSVLRLPAGRERLRSAAGGMALIGAAVLATALMNRAVFGAWSTPYERMTWETIGFFSYPAAAKLFWIFVDGTVFFGETDTALLFRYPWLFLALPGVIFWVRRDGWAAVAALATLALNWGLYLNYNDFFPSGLLRYSLIHYLAWAWAPLFALAIAALCRGWRERSVRRGMAAAVALMLLALGLQLELHPLSVTVVSGRIEHLPAARPLWVGFFGESLERAGELRLDGRALRENLDYQIPYVPSDLQLLLSEHARGHTLAAPPGVTVRPLVVQFRWRWRFDAARWRALWR